MSATDWGPLIGLATCLVALAPALIPLFAAVRGTPTMPRRWLFVLLATTSGYGFFALASTLGAVLFNVLDSWVSPQMKADALSDSNWVSLFIEYGYAGIIAVAALLTVVFSAVLTRFLRRRWSGIAVLT